MIKYCLYPAIFGKYYKTFFDFVMYLAYIKFRRLHGFTLEDIKNTVAYHPGIADNYTGNSRNGYLQCRLAIVDSCGYFSS